MNKKARIALRYFLIFSLIAGVLMFSFVIANHEITTSSGGTSYNVEEDLTFLYNITVSNTDTGQDANITQVNITIWGNFNFLFNSDGTDASDVAFTNTTSVLTWTNSTHYIINGSETVYFWFNATAPASGSYDITVTTLSSSGASTTNISVAVSSSAPSSVQFPSPTPSNGASLSQSSILVNVTATDATLETIVARLYNSSRKEVSSNTSFSSPLYHNFTGLIEGVYYINATANDTFGNTNSSATYTITLDTTDPVVTTISVSGVSSTGATLSVTTNEIVNSCNYSYSGEASSISSAASGTSWSANLGSLTGGSSYSVGVSCCDPAGNHGSNSSDFTTADASSYTPGGGGGSTPGKSQLWPKLSPNQTTIMKNFHTDYAIKEISIEVKNVTKDVKISVTKYTSKPAAVEIEKSGEVYKYLRIQATNLNDVLDKAVITIQIQKSWLENSSLGRDEVALFKYDNNTEKWNKLTTIYKEDDTKNYYYNVEITSFSYFAIAGTSVATTSAEDTSETTTPAGATTSVGNESAGAEEGGNGGKFLIGLWIIIGVGVLGVVAFIVFQKVYKPKDHKK